MQKTVEQVSLDIEVDIIVSVFTGNFLLEEDLLPSLFYARDRFLRAGGVLLPDHGTMFAQPVSMPEFAAEHIFSWQAADQFVDHSVMARYAVNTIYHDQFAAERFIALAEPQALLQLDFMQANEAACRSEQTFEVLEDGLLHGLIGWFDMSLGEVSLSTSPYAAKTHWSQVFLPLDNPLPLQSGSTLAFELVRPERGEWSWKIRYENHVETHSTFLSRPFSPAYLKRRSENFQPQLDASGEVALAKKLGN